VAKLLILGSSNAIPDEKHENTHMAVIGREHFVLIDCVNNPIVRTKQAGLDLDDLTDIIITHFHPDHVSGVPLLLMDMWLMGRQRPLNIHGLDYTLERLEKLMEFYDWDTWPNFYQVSFHRLPGNGEKNPVLENQDFRILASPVHHLVPNIGLRIEFLESDKSLAYSCDTEPCKEVENLAAGVDVLIHESAGETMGHTSAAQAGEIATKSGSASLYLIHYPTGDFDSQSLVSEAKTTFQGPVALAEDFMVLEF
jgi:ribonuclease Z